MLALLLVTLMALPAVLSAVALAEVEALATLGAEAAPAAKAAGGQDVPRVLLDQSPRAVEYQLARLTNDQLARVERHDTDVKYRPVYFAVLTRKGMARPFRDEALAAIAKMDRAAPTRVLLDVWPRYPQKRPTAPTATACWRSCWGSRTRSSSSSASR